MIILGVKEVVNSAQSLKYLLSGTLQKNIVNTCLIPKGTTKSPHHHNHQDIGTIPFIEEE